MGTVWLRRLRIRYVLHAAAYRSINLIPLTSCGRYLPLSQARQETWKDYEISSVGVLLPSQRPITAIDSNNKGAGGNDKKRNVCQTYDWFTALLTHFFGKCSICTFILMILTIIPSIT